MGTMNEYYFLFNGNYKKTFLKIYTYARIYDIIAFLKIEEGKRGIPSQFQLLPVDYCNSESFPKRIVVFLFFSY